GHSTLCPYHHHHHYGLPATRAAPSGFARLPVSGATPPEPRNCTKKGHSPASVVPALIRQG
ncbi:hypothetical protein, partial [Roseiflexus sp.]|uniref:hypothetical protein n=1 Tax=Roseiflexus sp. TaxID=2562120 RepID=UPI00398A6F3E